MQRIEIGRYPLEIFARGSGRPLLYLHGEDHFQQCLPFLQGLAAGWQVFAPRHPGFGASPLPDDFRSVDDLAYFYLDLLEELGLKDVLLVGSSLGGWIATEMCVRSCERVSGLVLIASVGVKFGSRENRDFTDLYALGEDEIRNRMFFDPGRSAPAYTEFRDEELAQIARDRQATALYAWRPYMHNPALRKWLHRVQAPALLLWGDSDGIVSTEFGRSLAQALPRATLKVIPAAGHYPQIEQLEATVRAIESFATA